jgi:hypothetical protein
MTPLVQVPSKPKPFTHLSYSSISTYQSCPLRWYFLCGAPHKKYYVAFLVMW